MEGIEHCLDDEPELQEVCALQQPAGAAHVGACQVHVPVSPTPAAYRASALTLRSPSPACLQLFMGSDLQAPPAVPKTAAPAAAAPAPPPVDTGRIQIQRCSSDGLREALMSS